MMEVSMLSATFVTSEARFNGLLKFYKYVLFLNSFAACFGGGNAGCVWNYAADFCDRTVVSLMFCVFAVLGLPGWSFGLTSVVSGSVRLAVSLSPSPNVIFYGMKTLEYR